MHSSPSFSSTTSLVQHNAPLQPLTQPQAPDDSAATTQKEKATPEQVLKGWQSGVERVALENRAVATAFFQNVVQGDAGDAYTAQAVFNDLITHEAYDVFVEVFSACNAILASRARADGKPFKSTLCLQLRRGWMPSAPEAMRKAMAMVQVQRLEAYRPCTQKRSSCRPSTRHRACSIRSPNSDGRFPYPRRHAR